MFTAIHCRNNPVKGGCFPNTSMETFMFTISSLRSGIRLTYVYTEDNGDCEEGEGGAGEGVQFRLSTASSHYYLVTLVISDQSSHVPE